ncbi:MAG: hypothetical protein ABIY55_29050, partial [Kofleriaceae bacterium]
MGAARWSTTTRAALWLALAGHVVVAVVDEAGSALSSTAVVVAIACSVLAIAALTAIALPEARMQRAVSGLTGAHGVAAALIAAGVAPGVPPSVPLTGLVAAAALGATSLVLARAATGALPARPLAMASRVAAIALLAQAFLRAWAASATSLFMPVRTAVLLLIAALA